MKIRKSTKVFGLAILALLASACANLIEPPSGYTIQYHDGANWMENLPDDWHLSRITIPGTHDSGADRATVHLPWYAPKGQILTQDYHIVDQLRLGVRWFDIRLRYVGDEDLPLHHGDWYLHKNFTDVLRWTIGFLEDHPTEIVVLMIKQEKSHVDSDTFSRAVYHHLLKFDSKYFYLKYRVPTVGEARGQIFIVRRFPRHDRDVDFGIYVNWENNTKGDWYVPKNQNYKFYVQDHWSLNTVPYDEKVEEVIKCIKKAHNSHDVTTFYLNYASGWKGYESVRSTAEGINYDVEDFLEDHHWWHCGVIMLNFAGTVAPDLVREIYCRNPNRTETGDVCE